MSRRELKRGTSKRRSRDQHDGPAATHEHKPRRTKTNLRIGLRAVFSARDTHVEAGYVTPGSRSPVKSGEVALPERAIKREPAAYHPHPPTQPLSRITTANPGAPPSTARAAPHTARIDPGHSSTASADGPDSPPSVHRCQPRSVSPT